MSETGKSAIILGATGLTGKVVLRELLDDPRYAKVKVFSRSPTGMHHPKLEEHLGKLLQLEDFEKQFTADEVYCCIGTTKARTPDREQYRKIDYGIPVAAASLARINKIGCFLVISSLGASAGSRIFYNRTKGEMELAVLEQHLPRTYILRPSLIAGKRREKRPGEWLARQLMKVLNLVLVGPLDKFRSVSPHNIARAMIWLANNSWEKVVIPSDEIRKIARKN